VQFNFFKDESADLIGLSSFDDGINEIKASSVNFFNPTKLSFYNLKHLANKAFTPR
jgi:hypothetical protein